jgi:hypothetical protein
MFSGLMFQVPSFRGLSLNMKRETLNLQLQPIGTVIVTSFPRSL